MTVEDKFEKIKSQVDNSEYRDKTYAIIGAAMEVHRTLGCGFLEAVYGDALELEFSVKGIPYEREKQISIEYKGTKLCHKYCADFVCYGDIIVEIKALGELSSAHDSQIINYLKATDNKIGLLINFGERHLVHKRFANNKK